MSIIVTVSDPGWQNQPVHKVTDTLEGARLDDHSEDQEVYGVESALRQMELHLEDNDDFARTISIQCAK